MVQKLSEQLRSFGASIYCRFCPSNKACWQAGKVTDVRGLLGNRKSPAQRDRTSCKSEHKPWIRRSRLNLRAPIGLSIRRVQDRFTILPTLLSDVLQVLGRTEVPQPSNSEDSRYALQSSANRLQIRDLTCTLAGRRHKTSSDALQLLLRGIWLLLAVWEETSR